MRLSGVLRMKNVNFSRRTSFGHRGPRKWALPPLGGLNRHRPSQSESSLYKPSSRPAMLSVSSSSQFSFLQFLVHARPSHFHSPLPLSPIRSASAVLETRRSGLLTLPFLHWSYWIPTVLVLLPISVGVIAEDGEEKDS